MRPRKVTVVRYMIIGASLSEPLLVRSTPALSVYIYIYIYIYIYYHVSYDRHLPRAHAYDLNSKAARGVYIERTSDVEVQRSQRSTWRSVATWTPSREEKQG